MSSRNAYLSAAERPRARALVEALSAAARVAAVAPTPTAGALRRAARDRVEGRLDTIDYVEVCDPDSLEPLPDDAVVSGRALIALAGRLGATRLIDNLVVREQPDPLG
jgi:pantoate--beta-alanine ligase